MIYVTITRFQYFIIPLFYSARLINITLRVTLSYCDGVARYDQR